MRPASGQVNRAVHTCSTVVHILVLRLSTPARYVAAPSLPHGGPARSSSNEGSINRCLSGLGPSASPRRRPSDLARVPAQGDFDAPPASAYSGTAACYGGSIACTSA